MVRQVNKVLASTRPEVVPEVVSNSPKVASEILVPNLFDIDPYTEPERPIRIDLDLDQLEDTEK